METKGYIRKVHMTTPWHAERNVSDDIISNRITLAITAEI